MASVLGATEGNEEKRRNAKKNGKNEKRGTFHPNPLCTIYSPFVQSYLPMSYVLELVKEKVTDADADLQLIQNYGITDAYTCRPHRSYLRSLGPESYRFVILGFKFREVTDLSGPVLRDTARLSQRYPPIARYGVFGVST